MKRLLACVAAAAFMSTPALADEMWEMEGEGTVFYKDDVGELAIFELDVPDSTVRFYFPELAGMLDDRGTHQGFWIDSDEGPCDSSMTGPDGLASNNWGRMILTFDKTTFPSS